MIPFNTAWLGALYKTLEYGDEVEPRGMKVKERLAVTVRFDANLALLVHPRRDINYRFAVAEWLWMTAGSDLVEPIARFNGIMRKFSDDGLTLAGAYGPRLRPQWGRVVRSLRDDRDSRQAVAVIWRPDDAARASKDVPCTVSAQFMVRRGSVHGLWTMRSSDLWLGLPYDAFTFARLTSCVAGELGLPVGDCVVTAGSSHLYEEHWYAARTCLEHARLSPGLVLDPLPGFPPRGLENLVINGTRGLLTTSKTPCFAWPEVFPEPWEKYARVLESPGKAEALKILGGA